MEHTRLKEELFEPPIFLDLPFFVWTILCKWNRTSHTQSEYPHVLLRPRVGSTRQSLLGYGHALVLYGHAFLGHRYSMVGRVWAGGYANPCPPAPECLLLIMETSNWPASHYWYGTSLPAH